MPLTITPITLREANAYVAANHRHHRPVRGCIACVAVSDGEQVRGVRVGTPIAKPSVCLPRQSFSEGETALKVYSENAGVLEAMLEAGARRGNAGVEGGGSARAKREELGLLVPATHVLPCRCAFADCEQTTHAT